MDLHAWSNRHAGVHRDDQSQRDSAAMGISITLVQDPAWFSGGGYLRSGLERELMSSMQRERSLALRILK